MFRDYWQQDFLKVSQIEGFSIAASSSDLNSESRIENCKLTVQ